MPGIQFTSFLRFIVIVGSLVAGLWVPAEWISFAPDDWSDLPFRTTISITAVIALYLYFYDQHKQWSKLTNWLALGPVLDVLTIAAQIGGDHPDLNIPKFVWLLCSIFVVRHCGHIKKFLDGFDSLQPLVYRLAPLLLVLPLLIQGISCMWIGLGSGTAGIDKDHTLTYVKAIYWAMTTLTTVGYGDIAAKTIEQMIFVCFVQVIGVAVFGYIVSNVAGLIARADAAREHHMDGLDKIETFMQTHGITKKLRLRVRGYYHYLWLNKKGYSDSSLLEGLPGAIQSELFFEINKSMIEKVPFLREANKDLIADLMSLLKPRIFVPGERIFRKGDTGDALYFIQSGNVSIQDSTGKQIALLKDGAFLGEMALISEVPRSATAQAQTFCDIYLLEKESFNRVVSHYPEFRDHLEEVVRARRVS